MTVRRWLENAVADAERRGLPALKPLLEALAQSTEVLRSVRFHDHADDSRTPHNPHYGPEGDRLAR